MKKNIAIAACVMLFLVIPGIFLFLYDELNFDHQSYLLLCVTWFIIPSALLSYLLVFRLRIIDGTHDSAVLRMIFFLLCVPFFAFVSFGGSAVLINKYCGSQAEIDIRGTVSKHMARSYKVNTRTYYLSVYDAGRRRSFEFEVGKDVFNATNESAQFSRKIKKGSIGIYYW